MFCSNCGKEIEDGVKFCKYCGQKIVEDKETEKVTVLEDTGVPKESGIASDTVIEKKKRNTGLVIAVVAVAVLLIAVGVLIFVMADSPAKKYEEQLKLAERYLDELDYDKAIAAYRAAIDIDPKAEDAYLGLADVYVEKGELQAAIDILKEGLEKTENMAMEERLAELERQLAEQKVQEQSKLTTPTPIPEPAGKGEANWRGGDWTNRDDILPYMNEEGYIVFGTYEQDGDESNGPEPIEWEVLDENDGKMLLISRYIIDRQPYNTEYIDVTWESCTLRNWLNDHFCNVAFSDTEQRRIITANLSNPDNPFSGTEGGSDTKDRIFCLSVDEIRKYFTYNSWDERFQTGYCQALLTEGTTYIVENGLHTVMVDENEDGYLLEKGYSSEVFGRRYGGWWLRSPGETGEQVCSVSYAGTAGWYSVRRDGDASNGVRPALYIEK